MKYLIKQSCKVRGALLRQGVETDLDPQDKNVLAAVSLGYIEPLAEEAVKTPDGDGDGAGKGKGKR